MIKPAWSAPKSIHACTTTRQGGVSNVPFDSFNLADHVGDDPKAVAENRKKLHDLLHLPSEPLWLKQDHTNIIVNPTISDERYGDGAYYKIEPGTQSPVLAIMTADCLPILITTQAGNEIAALHGGWRGLLAGVIESGVQHFQATPDELIVWFGPAIGQKHFEVGQEVYDAFIQKNDVYNLAFESRNNRFFMDIYQTAIITLHMLNIHNITYEPLCTYSDAESFFSYRRDGQTGRMATLIWNN